MLQNEYLDAKIGVDTAENEPSKDLYPSGSPEDRGARLPGGGERAAGAGLRRGPAPEGRARASFEIIFERKRD